MAKSKTNVASINSYRQRKEAARKRKEDRKVVDQHNWNDLHEMYVECTKIIRQMSQLCSEILKRNQLNTVAPSRETIHNKVNHIMMKTTVRATEIERSIKIDKKGTVAESDYETFLTSFKSISEGLAPLVTDGYEELHGISLELLEQLNDLK